jgi:lipopolysaccharide/colanic/teichoic acid biosynthesis glycosyltransferase
MTPYVHVDRSRRMVQSLRFQTLAIIVFAGFLPLLTAHFDIVPTADTSQNSAIASLVAALAALVAFRRVTAFPGTMSFAYILPAFASTYGLAIAILFFFRLSYSGTMLATGFAASVAITFFLALIIERRGVARFYVVPGGSDELVRDAARFEWVMMPKPELPPERSATIVADLRWDHDSAWERFLAEAALRGHPVYHTKQLHESLTGRVRIEHLSENNLGSLVPNFAYDKLKRLIDLIGVLVLLPVLVVLLPVIALAIRLDSPGPAIFRQRRMGYRRRPFTMIKFRTMSDRDEIDDEAAIHNAVTLADEERITRVGRFLRRTRLDELPQVFNIIRGEMSFIGPRPEAMPLSDWYERELPFYSYRHIVRPGLTGWAQVNQGHVADLDEVNHKLQYDFYYIKNFSAWLDIVIVLRTIRIVLFGFGWR